MARSISEILKTWVQKFNRRSFFEFCVETSLVVFLWIFLQMSTSFIFFVLFPPGLSRHNLGQAILVELKFLGHTVFKSDIHWSLMVISGNYEKFDANKDKNRTNNGSHNSCTSHNFLSFMQLGFLFFNFFAKVIFCFVKCLCFFWNNSIGFKWSFNYFCVVWGYDLGVDQPRISILRLHCLVIACHFL